MSSASNANGGLLLRVHRPDGDLDEFYVKPGLTIGRNVANTVVLAGDTAVDQIAHARVEVGENKSLWLRCPDPTSKMIVAGKGCHEAPLVSGTKIRIGKTELECVMGQRSAAPSVGPSASSASGCPFCGSDPILSAKSQIYSCTSCGEILLTIPAVSEHANPRWVPLHYGDYIAEQFVTRGGMGIVLRGKRQPRSNDDGSQGPTNVAIKLLDSDDDGHPAALVRFQREADLLSRLHHPHVVEMLALGNVAGLDYLVMKWIEGGSLRDILDRSASQGGLIPFKVAIRWFTQIVAGLDAIHGAGVIHRDLKPSNILIGSDNQVHIGDLGVAKNLKETNAGLTSTGRLHGTLVYMAPEQHTAPDTVDARSDLYSLGVTFYELLTNRRPLGAWEPASKLNSTVPVAFDRVIQRLLAHESSRRFQSAANLLRDLEAFTNPTSETCKADPATNSNTMSLPHKIASESVSAVTLAIAGSSTGFAVGILCSLFMDLDWRITGLIGVVVGGVAGAVSRQT